MRFGRPGGLDDDRLADEAGRADGEAVAPVHVAGDAAELTAGRCFSSESSRAAAPKCRAATSAGSGCDPGSATSPRASQTGPALAGVLGLGLVLVGQSLP